MSYFNARWLDSSLGRFISPDTIIPQQTQGLQAWDRFAYANNNSLKYVDISGHKACDEITSFGECIPDDVEVSDLPDIPEEPPQGDSTTPVQTGLEWLSGRGPRHHEFRENDPFTQELMKHPHLDYARGLIAARIQSGIYTTGNVNYNLSGIQGVPKYVKDYSTLTTGGKIGNLAVTYLGSYGLEYYVVSVNFETGEAVVLFHVNNSSTLSSATRPPFIGYLPVWTDYIEPQINRFTSSGPMSKTTQSFWWHETLKFR